MTAIFVAMSLFFLGGLIGYWLGYVDGKADEAMRRDDL